MLVQGSLLFLALGFCFLLVILAVEYFLWLGTNGRLVLFWTFVGIEAVLCYKFILTPLLFLFRIRNGISNKQASLLIGRHFPQVDDKLYNLLDLAEDPHQSELLLASLEQRSVHLEPIPFTNALDFGESLKYAKYLLVPGAIVVLVWISGNLSSFFGSYERVIHYKMAYEPPAPFTFELLSGDLRALENEEFTLLVGTKGDIRPENVHMVLEGKELLLHEKEGIFQYTFTPPLSGRDFYFRANGVASKSYSLKVLQVPVVQEFNVILDYPAYTGKKSDVLKSTGNASFPEGTRVTWKIKAKNTDNIKFAARDTSLNMNKLNENFEFTRRVYEDLSYTLSTSNPNVDSYETLEYRFSVIKDGYPTIRVNQVLDTLNPNVSYYTGEASDDYRVRDIKVVYYPEDDPDGLQMLELTRPNSNFDQFYYTFPSGLQLDEGRTYSLYFEVTDNDAIHAGKTTRSQVFSTAILDEDELRKRNLATQQALINTLDSSLENYKEQKEDLREISKEQKEKNQLNFNDQNQVRDFLNKQKEQEGLMQKFSKRLQESLSKSGEDEQMKELLRERLQRQEMEAKKNEKFLEELAKIADKIKKEELTKRLEELGKGQQNNQRNLEQLLELTKRYYVTEKVAQLARELEKQAEKQDMLSELRLGEDLGKREQEELNKAFEKLSEELNELEKDNEDLKKPLNLEVSPEKQEDIKEDQQEALEEINKQQQLEQSVQSNKERDGGNRARERQKSAAEKMKQLSETLGQSASGSSSSTITEDAEMLRQILDNLITFSFKQEGLHDELEASDATISQFSSKVRKQKELLSLFEHVDDSLFALSLRRVELSEFVNEQITEVYYNIEKSLESISENQVYQGVSYQKYVLNASNSLADFLAKLLDNMQQSMMSGSGSGQGNDFQLPDIIQGQGQLKNKMKGMGQSGEGQPQEGEGESPGETGKEGQGSKAQGEGGQEGEGSPGSTGGDAKGNLEEKGGNNGSKGEAGGQSGLSEGQLQEIYEIYKEQQRLRAQLEKQLQDMINEGDRKLGEKLLKQMEDFENDLLENGITQRALSKVNRIEYELMQLENAALRKGKKRERESNTNTQVYGNPILTKPRILENYQKEVEILNRQSLPLRHKFQNRVREYFKGND